MEIMMGLVIARYKFEVYPESCWTFKKFFWIFVQVYLSQTGERCWGARSHILSKFCKWGIDSRMDGAFKKFGYEKEETVIRGRK